MFGEIALLKDSKMFGSEEAVSVPTSLQVNTFGLYASCFEGFDRIGNCGFFRLRVALACTLNPELSAHNTQTTKYHMKAFEN